MEQLTREQAIEFHDSGTWKDMSFRERAEFQIEQDKLCMPFAVFQEAVGETLGRPVFTHEFGSKGIKRLKQELFHDAPAQTFSEVVGQLDSSQTVIISSPTGAEHG